MNIANSNPLIYSNSSIQTMSLPHSQKKKENIECNYVCLPMYVKWEMGGYAAVLCLCAAMRRLPTKCFIRQARLIYRV